VLSPLLGPTVVLWQFISWQLSSRALIRWRFQAVCDILMLCLCTNRLSAVCVGALCVLSCTARLREAAAWHMCVTYSTLCMMQNSRCNLLQVLLLASQGWGVHADV
jgi:hypothetical protein